MKRVAAGFLLWGLVALSAPVQGKVVFYDSFPSGRVALSSWTLCAQPWETNLGQCSYLSGGSRGVQVYANPVIVPGMTSPLSAASGNVGVSITARPLSDGDKALLYAAMAKQVIGSTQRLALQSATWSSGWLETRASFAVGSTVKAMFQPGSSLSSWSGLWMVNDVAHRAYHAEIDFAEVTNLPNGTMIVRQLIHWPNSSGQLQTYGCHQILPSGQWLLPTVTRTTSAVVFTLNGKTTCTVPNPPGFLDPMQIIFSQQVGGVAQTPTVLTQPFSTTLKWIEVDQP